jgi:hypothetical protein
MAEILRQEEAAPALWPAVAGVTGDELAAAWQRIEHFIARRFSARSVTWIVQGPGEFIPPLGPVDAMTAERWTGSAWEAVTLAEAPLGHDLPEVGPYRIEATVGAGPVPEAVATAVQRLAAYVAAEDGGPAGARSYSATVGQLSETIDRDPAHIAKALQNSGAADLLRKYRRA